MHATYGRKKYLINIIDESSGQVVEQVHFSGHPGYFWSVIKAMKIHTAKNAGYAGSKSEDPLGNFKAVEQEWEVPTVHGYLTRLTDKWCRMKNIYKERKNDLADESFQDTILDMANYLLLFLAYLIETGFDIKKEEPKEKYYGNTGNQSLSQTQEYTLTYKEDDGSHRV